MPDLIDAIIDRVHKRREKWHTIEVPELPMPEEFGDEAVIVGGYTRCGLRSRRRFIRSDVLISVDGVSEPPSSLAKDYLFVEYRRGPRLRDAQYDTLRKRISEQPLYANPCEFAHGVYIDIRACYWAIMSTVGWNVDYWPGRWLGCGRKPYTFPWQDHKVARNCLVSVAASEALPIWTPQRQLHTQPVFNQLANKSLYCLINDILNAIACDAVDIGAVYVHTDGFIAPSERVARGLEQLIRDWGLAARRKAEGRGWVASTQAYRVGSVRSRAPSVVASAIRVVREVEYRRWLQKRFAAAAASRTNQFADNLAASSSTASARQTPIQEDTND